MKRYLIILLSVSLLFSFAGCVAGNKESTDFYYLRSAVEFSKEDGLLSAETRNKGTYTAEELLTVYLKGPNSDKLISPFPSGCRLVRCIQDSTTITIVLSNELSTLVGYDLTLACACLTLTARSIYPEYTVKIRAESALLDGMTEITMAPEDLLLIDNTPRKEK